jgi:hypothetical protein
MNNNNKNIKKSIASANINFLIGSGVSAPFLETLTDIEKQLSEAEESEDSAKCINNFIKFLVLLTLLCSINSF